MAETFFLAVSRRLALRASVDGDARIPERGWTAHGFSDKQNRMRTVLSTSRSDWSACFADRVERMKASEIRELLKLLDQPDIISFAGGIPNPALFPTATIADAYAAILSDPATAGPALQYSTSEGYRPLRRWIADHMAELGVPCSPDHILITHGSQQALDFLGKLFLSPGDTALVTYPTYLGALQAFSAYQPMYQRLAFENTERTAASYSRTAFHSGSRLRLAYVVPDFSNPTGETLPRAAREHLQDLAEELQIPVIEDGAYEALRYGGEAVPSLLALDIARSGSIDAARTIYCGTFSKTLTPALRLGWICAAAPVLNKLVLIKQASDLHAATINQMVMHRTAETCFNTQVATARTTYRERRDTMLAALERHMPPGVAWTRPEGGMFVWMTLPEHLDGATLLEQAVRLSRVAFVPGKAFFVDGSGANTIRLSFSLPTPEKIDQGIARLGALLTSLSAGA